MLVLKNNIIFFLFVSQIYTNKSAHQTCRPIFSWNLKNVPDHAFELLQNLERDVRICLQEILQLVFPLARFYLFLGFFYMFYHSRWGQDIFRYCRDGLRSMARSRLSPCRGKFSYGSLNRYNLLLSYSICLFSSKNKCFFSYELQATGPAIEGIG